MKTFLAILVLPLLIFCEELAVEGEVQQPVRLSIISSDGSTVVLTDGSTYEIDPHDTGISGGWMGDSAEVIVVDTKSGSDYPILLTNRATGATVHARLISDEGNVPSAVEAPSEEDDSD